MHLRIFNYNFFFLRFKKTCPIWKRFHIHFFVLKKEFNRPATNEGYVVKKQNWQKGKIE